VAPELRASDLVSASCRHWRPELSSASYSVTNRNPVHRPLNHNIKAMIPTARINPAIMGEAKAAKCARRIQSRISKEQRQAQEAAIPDNPAVSTLFAASTNGDLSDLKDLLSDRYTVIAALESKLENITRPSAHSKHPSHGRESRGREAMPPQSNSSSPSHNNTTSYWTPS
jgi:hypothetical protein